VARDEDGRVTFVEGGAPGDLVVARLREEHKGYARASLERVVEPGAGRVAPPCAYFAADPGCGGCQWQHVEIAVQRAAKADIVRRALRRLDAQLAPIDTSVPALRWRRRARLRFRGGAVGYLARRSHTLIDVVECLQLVPELEAALAVLRNRLLGWIDGSGEVHLLLGAAGAVHVCVEAHAIEALVHPAEQILGEAGIAGVILRPAAGADVVIGAEVVDLGDDGDRPFFARADGFAQAAEAGNAALRRLVKEGAGDLRGLRVLELHAGSGNFTRDLVAAGARVVAVEDAAPAVELARRTFAARGLGDVDWRGESVTSAVTALAGERFDLLVLDPPRTGLNPGEADALRALQIPRTVYVSCDPETLGRDLVALGLSKVHATPLDLMPQTFHVETVVASRS
jgi:23S rRNA (uracil1939-C5)-methyltransferase